MNCIYSPLYFADLGGHVFPIKKYQLVAETLRQQHQIPECAFVAPSPATNEQLLQVHSQRYLDDLYHCRWTPRTLYAELPLTRAIVDMFVLACGGTILASELALRNGAAVHIGGGFHHAFAEKAEGFCYLNDLAVAVRAMLAQKKIKKAMVIDCDLHQGNGTAKIFQADANVFTFSIHVQFVRSPKFKMPYNTVWSNRTKITMYCMKLKNFSKTTTIYGSLIHQCELYPIKEKSDLDIHLRNGVEDGEYLQHLQTNIPNILDTFRPELILYQAGADPYEHDQLGALKLTLAGLLERDQGIFSWAKEREIPIAATLGGGYAYNTDDTVAIHTNTVLAAWKLWHIS